MTQQEIDAMRQSLTEERLALQSELSQMDYIGIKIATGRAKKTDYQEQIERMSACANRINEIDANLETLRNEVPDETGVIES